MSGLQVTIEGLRPWLDVVFDPSAGPGGQHVNKVSTRATLLFAFEECPLLAPAQKARLRQRLASRMAADGRLRVVAQRERSQSRNRQHAEQRLLELLKEATYVAPPRRATRPTRASRERRMSAKRQRGDTKRMRRAPQGD